MSYAKAVDTRTVKNVTETPFAWPHSAFAHPRNQLRSRGQHPNPNDAAPLTVRKGDSMMSEATLAWALAGAVSPCFTAHDHLGIYTTLGAGETYSAIEQMLGVAVHKRYPLPAKLISALAAWLDCYIDSEHEPTTRSLLNHVEPQALPTTEPHRSGRASAVRRIRPTRSARLITAAPTRVEPEGA